MHFALKEFIFHYDLQNFEINMLKLKLGIVTEFIQSFLSAGKKQSASNFNFTYRYIDDVL